ncbi:MAG TPA: S1C family serine protease [Geminicoccaceae bacterium]
MIKSPLRANLSRLRRVPALRAVVLPLVFVIAAHAGGAPAATLDSLEGVVQITAYVPQEARTASTLGTERLGTGVVIDDNGLILTIGYLILEAAEIEIDGAGPEPIPASIVAYDHESGFGLVRAQSPLELKPIPIGASANVRNRQPLLVVSRTGDLDAVGVYVVDRRDFAGYWEYLLEDAIFTAPPHAQFGGAALIDEAGRLVGIGSLLVNDAGFSGRPIPGNMFVPIDHLKPIMGDLLTRGRRADPGRPWLGVSLEEHKGRVFVTRVSPDGPAAAAGIAPDDVILGIDGGQVHGLMDFYRKLWSRGEAGIEVPLDVLQGMQVQPVLVKSGDRYRYLRLNPTY